MKKMRFTLYLIVGVIFLLLLSACGSSEPDTGSGDGGETESGEAEDDTGSEPEDDAGSESEAEEAPAEVASVEPAGTLIWALTSDPASTSMLETKPEQYVYQTMFNTLIRFNTDDFSIAPELASSWEANEDGTVWTFHLRDDVKWHDGEQFTAEDVKFTFDTIMDPDVNAGYHRGNLTNVASIDIIDDFTVQITMIAPDFDFLALLGDFMHIYPAHILEGIDNINEDTTFIDHPIGTGAFKFEEHLLNETYTVVANEDYFKGAPKLERVIFKILPDTNVHVAQLRTGEIDVSHRIGAPEVAALESADDVSIFSPATIAYWHVFMNNDDPLLQDPIVRQALTISLDRQQIIDAVMNGHGTLASGPVGPAYGIWRNDSLEPYPFDPAQAVELFSEAGWEDTNDDGILDKDVDGDGIRDPWEAEIIVIPHESAWADIALVAQQQWKDIGLDITLGHYDTATGFGKVRDDDFRLYVGSRGPVPSPIDLSRYYGCDAPGNWFHYCNEEVDSLIAQARQTGDFDERIALYQEAQVILLEDQPSIVMFYVTDLQAVSSRVQGWNDKEVRFNFLDIAEISVSE